MKGLLAKKLGMAQLFNPDGTTSAVTVLEAGPCRVLGLRTTEKDGYQAVRIAFGPVKEGGLNSPRLGRTPHNKQPLARRPIRRTARDVISRISAGRAMRPPCAELNLSQTGGNARRVNYCPSCNSRCLLRGRGL